MHYTANCLFSDFDYFVGEREREKEKEKGRERKKKREGGVKGDLVAVNGEEEACVDDESPEGHEGGPKLGLVR